MSDSIRAAAGAVKKREAKTDATRMRRMDQAIEWIAEDKGRNWKYAKC